MAVIYARQSLDRTGEGYAVERQITDCRKLADLRDVEITAVYVDNDRSATKGPRPEFDRLMADAERGDVDTIIAWHTDRLYRRLVDVVDIIALAEKRDLRIWTVRAGDIDLSTPTGRGLAVMMAAAARMEVEHKGARQRAANLQRAQRGVRHFGNRPYGYERENGVVRIVEPEAAIIRETVNRYIAGESWHGIAGDLRTRGVVGLSGRPFSAQNLRQRVLNPALSGVRTYLGDVVTEEGDWPPIIDKVTWERFQTAVAARAQHQAWGKHVKYLGSGIYRCGKCGGVMKVSRDHSSSSARGASHPPVYQCENLDTRRRLDKVDEMVETAVFDRLSQPDVLKLLSPTEDLSALARESQDLRERLDGLAALYADGTLTAAAVRSQKTKLEDRLSALQARLNAAEGGAVIALLASADDVIAHWRERLHIRDKRRIVDALMAVTIHPTRRGGSNTFRPEDVTIEWRS